MTTNNDDPIAKALLALPDEKVSPKIAAEVYRSARRTLELETSVWSRFDRLWMDRLMPAALFVMVAGYSVGFVDFLHRAYPGAEPPKVTSTYRTIVNQHKG